MAKKMKAKSSELLRAQHALRVAATTYTKKLIDFGDVDEEHGLVWAEEHLYTCARAYARLAELADQ